MLAARPQRAVVLALSNVRADGHNSQINAASNSACGIASNAVWV